MEDPTARRGLRPGRATFRGDRHRDAIDGADLRQTVHQMTTAAWAWPTSRLRFEQRRLASEERSTRRATRHASCETELRRTISSFPRFWEVREDSRKATNVTWTESLANHDVQRHRTSKEELDDMRAFVARDLADAKVVGLSSDRRFATAYNAVLQAANLAIACSGYRVTARSGHHRVTFDATRRALGSEQTVRRGAAVLARIPDHGRPVSGGLGVTRFVCRGVQLFAFALFLPFFGTKVWHIPARSGKVRFAARP
jgi:hypothetical protein